MNLEQLSLGNTNYRKVIYTDSNIQIVLMSLNRGEDIPLEKHRGVTQFIYVCDGKGVSYIDDMRSNLKKGKSLVIHPSHKHYIKNTSDTTLKLYTIYSPPEHKANAIQKRQHII